MIANLSSEHRMQRTEQAVSPSSVFPGQQCISQACATQWGEDEKCQMSINLSTVDIRVCKNKLGPGSPLGSLRDTHIINTTGVHVFPLIPDLKDNIRHGPQRRQKCGISVVSLCEVHAAKLTVDKAQRRDAEIKRQCERSSHMLQFSWAGRLQHDARIVNDALVS